MFGDSDREVEKFDLTSLVYLEAVIKESMRILPIAPIMARNVDRNLKLSKDGFKIYTRNQKDVYQRRMWKDTLAILIKIRKCREVCVWYGVKELMLMKYNAWATILHVLGTRSSCTIQATPATF